MTAVLGIHPVLLAVGTTALLVVAVSCAYDYWQAKGETRRQPPDDFYGDEE